MTLENVLTLSIVLFVIGLFGVLVKRNFVSVIMSLEIMFVAVVIAALGFSRFTAPTLPSPQQTEIVVSGHVIAIFVIVVAAAETALGLALMFTLDKAKGSLDVTEHSQLRG